MSHKRFFICSLLLLSLFSCPLTGQSVGRTYQYEGTVGPYAVHMHLMFKSDNTITGFYFYDSQRAKGNKATISLKGIYTGEVDSGELSLKELNASGQEIGVFFCELNGGHITDRDNGIVTFMHWISGGSGYRNFSSGKVYSVDLECAEIREL